MQIKKMIAIFVVLTAVFTSCKKEADEPNDEEVITTLRLTFAPVGGGNNLVYKYDDADGPGGNQPTKEEIVLQPNKSYNVSLQLLNKTVTPAEDKTNEINQEGTSHRFYYEPAAGSNITVSGLDNDANGVALGLSSNWVSGAAATGKIKITLRHYGGNPPGKAANDLVNSTKSSTDLEVEFNTRIQ
jgi:FlaG/FlaF family flagellin (archaellin)